jgi:(2R)-ethylmalonyl-CoA mutase
MSTPHLLLDAAGQPTRDAPWIFRTYAGHSSPRASNALYRQNLERGQTGLSIAFDLPTQCGYSSDAPIARPEVGKVGVPINSLDDFHVLFEGIPLERMNTSMTINGTAMWLLALYVALARERGVARSDAARHDPERHRQGVPGARHVHLSARALAADDRRDLRVLRRAPARVEPVERVQLSPAGGRRDAGAGGRLRAGDRGRLLDRIKARGRIDVAAFGRCVGRLSFFVNSGIRFVEEMCKMRAFSELWEELTRERYGITDPSCGSSATACRSTRSASPRTSPRTTRGAS